VTLDVLPVLTVLLIGGNTFHGPLPDFPIMDGLVWLDISYNFLSGALPAFISRQENLTALRISNNIFTGQLEDLIDANVQTRVGSVDISHNPFFGTMPSWLFAPSMVAAKAGYNCFHGTLPAAVCAATQLFYLDLRCLACHAHCTRKVNSNEAYFVVPNLVHGSLPACLFGMERLNTLVASENYFSGSLPDKIALDPDFLEVDLSYNQLTGPIPEALQQLLRLPDDPVYAIDISNNKLFGGFTRGDNLSIPDLDLSNNRMSGPSVEGSWVKDDSAYAFQLLDGNLFSCAADRSDLHPRDSAYERYDCGSDSVVKPLYALLACACALGAAIVVALVVWRKGKVAPNVITLNPLQQIRVWANAVLSGDPRLDKELPELRRVMKVMRQLTVVAVVCALVAVVVLAPLFATLTAYYGTHDYEYAWTVSSVLLAGRVPFALCFAAFVCTTGWAAGKLGWDNAHTVTFAAKVMSPVRKLRVLIACALYLAINFAVVGGVNAAFVAIETYATPAYQIALSVFKVGWNLAVAPFLSRYLAYELSAARAEWVGFELFVSIMCNIGIPLLAIVVVSPRCLFGLVGSQISSIYSPETYDSLMYYESRPFHYSYQCSFQYVNSYVAAFEYMCFMTSFVTPLSSLLIEQLLRRVDPGSFYHRALEALLPRVLRPIATDPDRVPRFSVLSSFFDCTQFFISQFTYLTMICTVGLVFPPLAATAAVAMVIAQCFAVLSLGRVMTNARAAGVGAQYAQLIEAECARVANPVTVRHAVWLLLGFCGVFFPIFLFDTLGDTVGVYESYWVLIAVPIMSAAAILSEWVLRGKAKTQARYGGCDPELPLVGQHKRDTHAAKEEQMDCESAPAASAVYTATIAAAERGED
jgi:hypothetical protein